LLLYGQECCKDTQMKANITKLTAKRQRTVQK